MKSSAEVSVPPIIPAQPVLALDGPLTLATVAQWRPRLAQALSGHGALVVDPRAATDFDGFGVQLLCSARRSAMLASRPFRLVTFPEHLARACARAGVKPDYLAPFNPSCP